MSRAISSVVFNGEIISPLDFAISGVVFNSATVAELGYLKGGDRKSDEFQKLTVGLRSTKEIAHDIDRG